MADFLFIYHFRNLSFDTTEEGLEEYFAEYGPLKYAKIVMNPETEHSKGVILLSFIFLNLAIFVQKSQISFCCMVLHCHFLLNFVCINLAIFVAKNHQIFLIIFIQLYASGLGFVRFCMKEAATKCLQAGEAAKIALDGRQLYVSLAVSREKAATFREKKNEEKKDNRNLHLAREGSKYWPIVELYKYHTDNYD